MASTSVVLPWSPCAIMAMLRSFEFIVCRFVMSMRPNEQGCKRYLATPIELREVSGATNACLFYHAAPNSTPFSGVWTRCGDGPSSSILQLGPPLIVLIAQSSTYSDVGRNGFASALATVGMCATT